MGDIIAFELDNPSSFTITATIDKNDIWQVSIDQFYNSQMPESEVLREVSEALIPIAGGLLRAAEALEPTKRGNMVVNISIFESGYIDFSSAPIDTEDRLNWFMGALDAIRTMANEKYERLKASS